MLQALNDRYTENIILGTISDDDLRSFIVNEMMPTLKKISDKVGRDIVHDAIEFYTNNLASMSEMSKWLGKHLECFDEAMEYGILTYMPMLSVVSEISKENFANDIMQMYESKEFRIPLPHQSTQDASLTTWTFQT